MVLVFLAYMGISFFEGKKDYDKCKAEEFKPKVCQKWVEKRKLPNW